MVSDPRRISAAITALLAAGTLAAAEVPREDQGAQVSDLGVMTVIANKSGRPVGQVAGTVTVIDAEQMEDQLAADLRDLFRYEPGISVGHDPNRFGLRDVNIRGLDGNRVNLEVDGVRLPKGFSVGSFADAGRDFVDPEVLKRVEVLRGPASTLYGSDALGGVVTFTTKDPDDYLLGNGSDLGLKAGYNGDDQSRQGTITAAARQGALQGLVVYSRRDGDETDVKGASPNPQDYTDENWIAKMVWRGASGNRLRLTYDRNHSQQDTDVRSVIGGPGKFATTTAMFADDEYTRDRISLDQTLPTGAAWADSVDWRLTYQSADTDQDTIQDRSPSRGAPNPTRRYRSFEYEEDTYGGEILVEKAMSLGAQRHTIVYGGEVWKTRIEEIRDGLEVDLVTGETTTVLVGESLPVRDFPKSDILEAGLFVQDEITWRGSRWTVIPGLRYEYYDLDPDSDSMYLEDNPDIEAASIDEKNLSPKLGVLYDIDERWSAFAQYAHGFRSPPAEDVNIGFTIPAFNFVALPNPDLDPERSDGVELGLRYLAGGLSMDIAGFYNRYEDLIESRVNLGVDPDTGVLVFQSQNRDRATIYGFEYRAYAHLGEFNSRLDGLSLRTSLAWSRGTDEKRNEPLNSVDPATGVLGLAYGPAGGKWNMELVGTFVASKDRVDNSNVELFEPSGYARYDLIGSYSLGGRARLRLGVFNLTDKKYWEWADVQGLPADYYALDLYASPGRYVSASLNMSW